MSPARNCPQLARATLNGASPPLQSGVRRNGSSVVARTLAASLCLRSLARPKSHAGLKGFPTLYGPYLYRPQAFPLTPWLPLRPPLDTGS